ncbi:MAG: ABC transporter permease [Cyanobacteria bacterium P01_A01_bin.84]
MLKILTKLDYLLKETFLGLRRGGWMNWAAVSTVTVLLFLCGMSLQTSWLMSKFINQFGTQLEVSVYMKPTVSASAIMAQVTNMVEITNIETITKEQAWSNLVQELGISDIASATEQLDGNPLVDEIKVKALSSDMVPNLATELAKLQGVETVQYVDEAVRRIAQLHQGLNWVTLTITFILTLTAIAVINTTIRLIVMARRREIEVMQLVGATYTWIYLPFIFQGVTFGLLGGAIAWGFISCLQQFLAKFIANQPEFIKFLANGLELSTAQFFLLPLILLSFGSAVGFMGSIFAVRQFAKT